MRLGETRGDVQLWVCPPRNQMGAAAYSSVSDPAAGAPLVPRAAQTPARQKAAATTSGRKPQGAQLPLGEASDQEESGCVRRGVASPVLARRPSHNRPTFAHTGPTWRVAAEAGYVGRYRRVCARSRRVRAKRLEVGRTRRIRACSLHRSPHAPARALTSRYGHAIRWRPNAGAPHWDRRKSAPRIAGVPAPSRGARRPIWAVCHVSSGTDTLRAVRSVDLVIPCYYEERTLAACCWDRTPHGADPRHAQRAPLRACCRCPG